MDLNTRIDFIVEKHITDDEGFDVSTEEVVYYSCWANRKVLSASKEFLASGTDNYKEIVSFGVRYCPFTSELDSLNYKIKHKGKTYNIVQIDDTSKDFIYLKGENVNGK